MSFMNLIMGFFGVPWLFFFTKQFGLCFSCFLFLGSVFFSRFSVFENMVGYLVWRVSGGGSLQIISCFYFGALLCSCFVWVLLPILLLPLPKLFEVSGMGSETLPNALGYYFM